MKTLLAAALFVLGISVGHLLSGAPSSDINEKELRMMHTAAIDALGELAAQNELNADIMMRYSHYTEPHREMALMCPECTKDEKPIDVGTFAPEEERNVDTKPDQGHVEDAGEILTSILQMGTHAKFQTRKLEHTLMRLRQGFCHSCECSEEACKCRAKR